MDTNNRINEHDDEQEASAPFVAQVISLLKNTGESTCDAVTTNQITGIDGQLVVNHANGTRQTEISTPSGKELTGFDSRGTQQYKVAFDDKGNIRGVDSKLGRWTSEDGETWTDETGRKFKVSVSIQKDGTLVVTSKDNEYERTRLTLDGTHTWTDGFGKTHRFMEKGYQVEDECPYGKELKGYDAKGAQQYKITYSPNGQIMSAECQTGDWKTQDGQNWYDKKSGQHYQGKVSIQKDGTLVFTNLGNETVKHLYSLDGSYRYIDGHGTTSFYPSGRIDEVATTSWWKQLPESKQLRGLDNNGVQQYKVSYDGNGNLVGVDCKAGSWSTVDGINWVDNSGKSQPFKGTVEIDRDGTLIFRSTDNPAIQYQCRLDGSQWILDGQGSIKHLHPNGYQIETPTPGGGTELQGFSHDNTLQYKVTLDPKGKITGFEDRNGKWTTSDGIDWYNNQRDEAFTASVEISRDGAVVLRLANPQRLPEMHSLGLDGKWTAFDGVATTKHFHSEGYQLETTVNNGKELTGFDLKGKQHYKVTFDAQGKVTSADMGEAGTWKTADGINWTDQYGNKAKSTLEITPDGALIFTSVDRPKEKYIRNYDGSSIRTDANGLITEIVTKDNQRIAYRYHGNHLREITIESAQGTQTFTCLPGERSLLRPRWLFEGIPITSRSSKDLSRALELIGQSPDNELHDLEERRYSRVEQTVDDLRHRVRRLQLHYSHSDSVEAFVEKLLSDFQHLVTTSQYDKLVDALDRNSWLQTPKGKEVLQKFKPEDWDRLPTELKKFYIINGIVSEVEGLKDVLVAVRRNYTPMPAKVIQYGPQDLFNVLRMKENLGKTGLNMGDFQPHPLLVLKDPNLIITDDDRKKYFIGPKDPAQQIAQIVQVLKGLKDIEPKIDSSTLLNGALVIGKLSVANVLPGFQLINQLRR